MTVPILAVTSGEPAGIGPDICLDLPEADLPCRCVVLGDKTLLQARAQALGKSVQLQDYDAARAPAAGVLEVLHIPLRAPCEAGRLSTENAPYVLQLLDRAYEGVQAGDRLNIEIERSTQVVVDTVREAVQESLGALQPVLEAILQEKGLSLDDFVRPTAPPLQTAQ